MVSAPKYEKNVKCTNPWEPRRATGGTLNNAGSVPHNIINHQASINYSTRGADNAHYGRGKGVAEFSDLKHPFQPN